MFEQQDDHYSLLEVPVDASFQEIRNAYLRLKAMLSRDNLAGYALMSREECEELQRKTEEAYLTLSNPARRREYDRRRREALLAAGIDPSDSANPPATGESATESRELHPFFDSGFSSFAPLPELEVPATDSRGKTPGGDAPEPARSAALVSPKPQTLPPSRNPNLPERRDHSDEIIERLSRETEWSGTLIRWVREKRGLTIEELSELTKVSRTYLIAIEEERYEKLPAPVYLRGFMLQVARYLKLPQDRLVTAYLARWAGARRDDSN